MSGESNASTATYQRQQTFNDNRAIQQPLLSSSHIPTPTPSRRSNSPKDKAKIKCLICELVALANLVTNLGDYYIEKGAELFAPERG